MQTASRNADHRNSTSDEPDEISNYLYIYNYYENIKQDEHKMQKEIVISCIY